MCQTSTTSVNDQGEQQEGQDHLDRLRGDQGLALGQRVGDEAAEQAEDQTGTDWIAATSRVERVAGELEDQPALGDRLHPGADERDSWPPKNRR